MLLWLVLPLAVALPQRDLLVDASPLAPQAVGFAEAVRAAMSFSGQTTLATEDIATAEGTARQVRGALSPNVGIQSILTLLDHDREIGGRLLSGRKQFNGALNANIPILAPRRWADYAEARGATRVARARLDDARRQSAVSAAYAYLDVVADRRAVQVTAEAVRTASAHDAIAHARLDSGIGNRLDVLRAADDLHDSEVQKERALASLIGAQEMLGVLMGRNAPADATEDWPVHLQDMPTTSTASDANASIAAIRSRADVVLSHQELLQAQQIRRHSWLDYMPTILGTGQYFLQDPPTSTYPKHGWQLQAIVLIPLWENGQRQGAHDIRRADERRTLYKLDLLERSAKSQLRAALGILTRNEAALRDANARADSAKQGEQLTADAYQRGTMASLEVVDAQRRSRDAAIDAASAEDGLRRARLNVLVAGGQFP